MTEHRSPISAELWPQRALPVVGWDSALLQPVAEINELMLEILRATAARLEQPPRLISALREPWRELSDHSQRRLARCPFLLLDAGFASAERWDLAELTELTSFAPGVRDGAAWRGYFSSPAGVALVRRALVFGWHLARSNRLSARVLLGMSSACADRIASSALKHLEALAELCPPWIMPRWESQPLIWRQMIQAAVSNRDAVLRGVQWRGLQLLAAGERRTSLP